MEVAADNELVLLKQSMKKRDSAFEHGHRNLTWVRPYKP